MAHPALKKVRKLVETIDVDVGDGEKATFDVRKPTMGDKLRALDAARAAGDLDADNRATSGLAGGRMLARFAQVCLFNPASGQPAFTEAEVAELVDVAWLEGLGTKLQGLFVDAEAAKGN